MTYIPRYLGKILDSMRNARCYRVMPKCYWMRFLLVRC